MYKAAATPVLAGRCCVDKHEDVKNLVCLQGFALINMTCDDAGTSCESCFKVHVLEKMYSGRYKHDPR